MTASLASAYNSAVIDPPEHTVAVIPLLETKLNEILIRLRSRCCLLSRVTE